MIRLDITPQMISFLSFFFFLCEVQLSGSRLLREVDYHSNSDLSFHTRILENLYVSCDTECVSDVGNSKKKDHIIINLGPSANYTLTFPIPDDGKTFSLKTIPGSTTDIRVFMQASEFAELVPFDYYWTEDDGWMEIYIGGTNLEIFEGGKAVLVLFNYGDQVDTLTVKFDFLGPSDATSTAVVFGLLGGLLVGVPLLFALTALVIRRHEIYEKLKNLSCTESIVDKSKRLCTLCSKCCTKKDQWSQAQVATDAMGAQERQTAEEHRFQDHMVNLRHVREEDNIIDLQGAFAQMEMDGRQDPDIVAVEKKPELIVPIFPLTTESVKYRFPEAKFEDLEYPFSQPMCSVCLDRLTLGDTCRQLYCKHVFHSECIELWLQNQLLKNKACCPNCNADMM